MIIFNSFFLVLLFFHKPVGEILENDILIYFLWLPAFSAGFNSFIKQRCFRVFEIDAKSRT